MAVDIYNRRVDLGKPLAADATRLTYAGAGAGEDQLVQNMAIQYAQNITRLWDVGSSKVYFFAGRTQGSIQLKRVVGGAGPASAFIKRFGDVCLIEGNHMTFFLEAGCDAGVGTTVGQITASGCVISSLTYSVAAADMIINEEMTMMFARLEPIGNEAAAAAA